MNNAKVRIKMMERGIKQWELARLLGMSESVLSRKLRDELPEDEQDRIIGLIEKSGGEHDEVKNAPSVTPTVSEDCISRADLLGKMKSLCPEPNKDCGYCHKGCDIEDCIDFVVDAPSVVPTERTGEWVDYGDEEYICSICGYSKVHEPNYPFCPNCGAKMG